MKYTFFCKNRKLIAVLILVCMGVGLYISADTNTQCGFQLVEKKPVVSSAEIEKIKRNVEANVLFDAFLSTEAMGLNYVYVCHDYDADGQIELCLKHKEENRGIVLEYKNHGLQYSHFRDVSDIFSAEWNWADIPEIYIDRPEMTHLGMYVQVSENEYGEDSFWYLDEADFLAGNGLADANPYYAYYDENGNALMVLYYNEQTQHGCGIRYYERDPSTFETTGMYGFTFTGAEKGNWEGTPDFFNTEGVGGGTGEASVVEYQEHYEYDNEGKVLHFFSEGLWEWFSEEPEETFLIDIEFIYDEQGRLKERYYQHNSYVFGTWYTLWACYFDGQERIEHEYIYVTHGHIENYYIYLDDDDKPEYILRLDCNMGNWLPEYTEY